HADAAEPASPARRSDAVRPRQPQRNIRRDRPAVRTDRGDDHPVARLKARATLAIVGRGFSRAGGDIMAADLSTTFTGVRLPNPFLLSSAPPPESESKIVRAFEGGGGVGLK